MTDRIWQKIHDPQSLSLVEALDIEFEIIEPTLVRAKMPVSHKTIQYFRMLHGGASVALAESVASVGANVHIDNSHMAVGLEINANHLRPAKLGESVVAEARPVHLGKKTQVWSIEIKNLEGNLVCISRCTLAVVPKK